MVCQKCGAEIDDDSKFCMFCGQKIEATPQEEYCNKCGEEVDENNLNSSCSSETVNQGSLSYDFFIKLKSGLKKVITYIKKNKAAKLIILTVAIILIVISFRTLMTRQNIKQGYFAGAKWGDSKQITLEKIENMYKANMRIEKERVCGYVYDFEGIKGLDCWVSADCYKDVGLSSVFLTADQKEDGVSYTIRLKHFKDIVKLYVERYGEPEYYSTAYITSYSWKTEASSITVSDFSYKGDEYLKINYYDRF
ncbi:zinc ribbon domain-containing protein [[Clostridium] aminophilum]|uniref:Zinc-ribbon domain-containing protein n=1 Tax=[Clostridium] aminophilum TaxID=1526 RepID=A0A1I6ISG3_9FIRM|nr:zinc ribbon domain-containing protein [[Clostridium] aminophilum]SFR69672.1 zinc-ribbon domain-containing protein [[Clostridium] aminophilum]